MPNGILGCLVPGCFGSVDRVDAFEPAVVRQRQVNNDPRQARIVKLADMRIQGERDDELVNVPMPQGERLVPVQPPVDDRSAHLSGKDYLQFLATDSRLLPATRVLIRGPKILGDPHINAQKIESLATRLRPVMAQAYVDAGLLKVVDDMACEASAFCGDRTEYFIGHMQDAALLSTLARGNVDDITLYNCGIAFFKLDAVRTAVGKRCGIGTQNQNVHSYLDAEYYLQDELGLPTKHDTPVYPDQCLINRGIAREIGNEVRALTAADDGDHVMQFMSNWGPWKEHLKNAPQHAEKFEEMMKNYHALLEDATTQRENPESTIGQYTDKEYMDYANLILSRLEDWNAQLVGQLSREFLLNNRADLLINSGAMPKYFQSFQQR
jgi:hypothetical protein